MSIEQLLVIARGSVPIHLQIKEQIKWLIVEGYIHPGDSLPSARDLSEALGVNRNTINAAYNALREEGTVEMGRGFAARIADTDRVRQLPSMKRLLELVDQSLAQADSQGFAPEEFAMAALIRSQRVNVQQGGDRVPFIDCGEHEVDYFLEQIEDITGRPAVFLTISQVRENPAIVGDTAVTTVFHAAEVREVVPSNTTLVVVGAMPVLRTVMELAQLPAESRVAFVFPGNSGGLWIRNFINGAGLHHLSIDATGYDDPGAKQLLQSAAVIYAAPSIFDRVSSSVPDPTRVRRLNLTLDPVSQATLASVRHP